MKLRPLSLRTKLILSFLGVIVLGALLTMIFGSRPVRSTIIDEAQKKVKHDLSSAWMVFDSKLNYIRDIISFNVERESIQDAIIDKRNDILLRYLNRVRSQRGLDILTLTDSLGKVIVRTRNPEIVGDDQSQDEIVKKALTIGDYAAPQIVSPEELLKEGKDLADRAYMEFVPTPKAAPRPEDREINGMMLKAASSVVDERGNILGVLYGGILINRTYEIVDLVKELVYKGETYKGREIGTATIFQHDLRVSTNVRNEKGERAIGTRVSKEVNTAVLERGEPWIDRAFVVNDWYITAYEPIRNINDEIIGILYVGMLERPYIDTTNRVIFRFAIIAILCVVLLLVILIFSTTRIINPLQKMVMATQRIAKGDLTHKLNVRSRDEIGALAQSFDRMTEELRLANLKLIEWGKTLEKKVEERTDEIRKMQSHLIQQEKLASLGKLAAGIAHEINNPLGGILIYSHLLLEDTRKKSPQYDNLKKIVKETTRCKDIVKGLLQFARPKDPEMIKTDINEILENSLSIMERQALFQNIKLQKKYSTDLPKIVADSAQLQQVFMNIILNAAEAMDGKGILTIKAYLERDGNHINVEFTDTGHGIKEEDKKRLFEPFFTTKEVGMGTGLGLAISYSIIQKHEGTIKVTSQEGKGSTFTVILPVKREINHDEND
ncbi:MAG: cache domain-containing protein [Candidatus Aminicenantes bacterium]|nr:cache domain-containing protein [Candidatus Aminicenantes bacterium]